MGLLGALGPAQRQFHRATSRIQIRRIGRALIKDHDDVRAQRALHLHGFFRPHEHLGTINRRGEVHPLLLDLAHGTQTEYLKAAGVGQNRPLPLHEIVQVTVPADHLGPRAQPQMEGIAENDLRTDRLDIARQHALHRTVGTHRHKGRRLDHPAGEGQPTTARPAIGGKQFKGHVTHDDTSGPVGAGLRVMNIASP